MHIHSLLQGADPYAALVALVDDACMRLYAAARRNARKFARVALTVLPLMMLMVGSCKTSQLPGAYGSNAGPEQFRTALFPDRVNFRGAEYYPAEGYIARAQKYVAGTPESLTMLTEKEITYLFGKPTLHRAEAGAEVWQYKAKNCVVDFYFYGADKTKTASPVVSYVDVRRQDSDDDVGSRTDQAKCLGRVIGRGDAAGSRV